MSNTPVRTAFLGGGLVAEVHQQALQRTADVELVGLYDPDAGLAGRRAADWGCRAFASVEDVLTSADVEAVHLLAPSELHEELAVAAMRSGKHVLVEKPVSTADGVRHLMAVADECGLVCMPGHNYAYQPEFTRLRSLVRDEQRPLGTIRAAWITYCIHHGEEVASRYSGVLDEVMVHHAYLAIAAFGRPDWLIAGTDGSGWRDHPAEDQAWMTWRYGERLSVHQFASFAVDDPTTSSSMFTVKVLGTHGGVTYNWSDAVFRRPIGSLAFGLPAYEETYVHENRAFAAAVRGDREQIVSPIGDALVAAEVAVLAQASAASRTPVTVEATS